MFIYVLICSHKLIVDYFYMTRDVQTQISSAMGRRPQGEKGIEFACMVININRRFFYENFV